MIEIVMNSDMDKEHLKKVANEYRKQVLSEVNNCNKITTFDIESKFDEVITQLTFLNNYLMAFERAWDFDLQFYKTMVTSVRDDVTLLKTSFQRDEKAIEKWQDAKNKWG